MNSQVERESSVGDILKQFLSIVLIIMAISGFYYFADVSFIYRVLGLVAFVILALGLVLTTSLGRSVWSFILESKIEVRKVVWPSRQETFRTTILVFAMVFVVGTVLWFFDMFLFWGIRFLMGEGS